MTIIETTVMLSVMFILAGVLSPIVSESVSTARAVKAKNDASMIAAGLINLQKDLGADALSAGRTTTRSMASNRLPDVLISEGSDPATEDRDTPDLVSTLLQKPSTTPPSAQAVRAKWLQAGRDLIDDYLVTNHHGFRARGPGENSGWNGPYLSAKLAGDPWGNRYMINTCWLDGGASATDSAGNPRVAVYVVSAGANGIIETPFMQPITDAQAYGDDIVVRIQ